MLAGKIAHVSLMRRDTKHCVGTKFNAIAQLVEVATSNLKAVRSSPPLSHRIFPNSVVRFQYRLSSHRIAVTRCGLVSRRCISLDKIIFVQIFLS